MSFRSWINSKFSTLLVFWIVVLAFATIGFVSQYGYYAGVDPAVSGLIFGSLYAVVVVVCMGISLVILNLRTFDGETSIEKSVNEPYTDPALILFLCIPVSLLYIARASFDLRWAAIGYVLLGLAFGILQSLIVTRRPFWTAFVSTATVPLCAYFVFAILRLINSCQNPNGCIIENLSTSEMHVVEPDEYYLRFGPIGPLLYLFVLGAISSAFGLTGVSGRFIGLKLLPFVFPNAFNGRSLAQITLNHLRQQLAQHRGNLNKLEVQVAIYGDGERPLWLLNKIEFEQKTIEELEMKIRNSIPPNAVD